MSRTKINSELDANWIYLYGNCQSAMLIHWTWELYHHHIIYLISTTVKVETEAFLKFEKNLSSSITPPPLFFFFSFGASYSGKSLHIHLLSHHSGLAQEATKRLNNGYFSAPATYGREGPWIPCSFGKDRCFLSEGHRSQDLSTAVPWARHPPQAFLSSHVKGET